MSQVGDIMENQFWEFFVAFDKELFMKLAEIDEDEYARFQAYNRGEAKRRPRSQKRLRDLREKFLDNLDAHEIAREQGLLV